MYEPRVKSIHDDAYQVLVECLRDARKRAGLTQAELGARLGLDQSYISKYERAERRLDVLELRSVCHALNLTLGSFVAQFERELSQRGLA